MPLHLPNKEVCIRIAQNLHKITQDVRLSERTECFCGMKGVRLCEVTDFDLSCLYRLICDSLYNITVTFRKMSDVFTEYIIISLK